MRLKTVIISLCVGLTLALASEAQNIITTVVGGAATGPGDGGAATLAFLSAPFGITLDKQGNLYIVDQVDQRIRKVNPQGIISTLAGSGVAGFQDGTGTQAMFNFPTAIRTDANGNLIVADWFNHRVRMIDPTGRVTTIAGTGAESDTGDGGPATAATFKQLFGVAADNSGNIYVSDNGANRIRRINSSGQISTVVGTGTPGFSGDGSSTGSINSPIGLAYDSAGGSLYFADSNNGRVRRLAADGTLSTFAGCGTAAPDSNCPTFNLGSSAGPPAPSAATKTRLAEPQDVYVAPDGVYILDLIRSASLAVIWRVDASGNMNLITFFTGVAPGLAVVSQTQIFVTENQFLRGVLQVTPARTAPYAGGGLLDNMAATSVGLVAPPVSVVPAGIRVDSLGNILISDYGQNRIRKIDPNGVITTIAGNGAAGTSGDGGSALRASIFAPLGLDYDTAGNIYFAEAGSNRIRKIDAAGNISTFAGGGPTASTGGVAPGDGGPATSAALSFPTSVAVDRSSGNIFISELGGNRIRKVDSAGKISTYGGKPLSLPCPGTASFSCGDGGQAVDATIPAPIDLVLDGSGNLYIAERYVNTQGGAAGGLRIRKIDTSGKISTIAGNGLLDASGEGNPALSASLGTPSGLAIDRNSGTLFVSDDNNHRIIRVSANVTRLVGTTVAGYGGDDGIAIVAQINRPKGLAMDNNGNLLFWDSGNNRIRKVAGVGNPVPRAMVITDGNQQSGGVGTVLPKKVSVGVFDGATPVSGVNVTFAVTPSGAATLNPTSALTNSAGIASTTVTLGSSAAKFTVTASANGLQTQNFSETVFGAPGAVTNGASFSTAAVSPGALASLFGQGMATGTESATALPLPSKLSTDTSLKIVSGSTTTVVPLVYVSPTQINFQVPFEIGTAFANLILSSGGTDSAPLPISVTDTSPGIFTASPGGTGPGAILHGLTQALVNTTNPAKPGEIILIYCTGLGAVNPAVKSGDPAPGDPVARANTTVSVSIGGSSASVDFAGLAPGFAGLYQVNAIVPTATAAGAAVPVIVTAGNRASNTVTIAVAAATP